MLLEIQHIKWLAGRVIDNMRNTTSSTPSHNRGVLISLIVVFCVALVIRLWGIDFGLPYLYHPDEPNKIEIAQTIIKTGDWDPHYYLKPSLFIYLNTIVYYPYYIYGHITGIFNSVQDIDSVQMLTMGVGYAPDSKVVLLGRFLSVLFGMGCVVLSYILGEKITQCRTIGLIAALFSALSPTMVTLSRYITPDIQMTFFLLLTWLFCWRIYKQGGLNNYLLAGLFCGLTISTKYNGGLILIMIPIADALHRKNYQLIALIKNKHLWLAAGIIVLTFLVTTPGAITSTQDWFTGLSYEFSHYRSGHQGAEGTSFLWYLNYSYINEPVTMLLALISLVIIIRMKDWDWIFVSIFPCVYLFFISIFSFHNDRTFLPVIPFFILMAVFLIQHLWKYRSLKPAISHGFHAITLVLILSSTLLSINLDINNSQNITRKDAREYSRIWINDHIEPGSKIALESYSPFLDPNKYKITGLYSIITHDLDWYQTNGYDYLVFSSGMFQRFFVDPERYPSEIASYERLFSSTHLVNIFSANGYEVRIYSIE